MKKSDQSLKIKIKIEYLGKLHIKQTQYLNYQALQDGYLGFSKFWVYDPTNFQKYKFWKTLNELQIISKFQKPEYTL